MKRQAVELNNKKWDKIIDSVASRISGKVTAGKIWARFPLIHEDGAYPSREYVKAYWKEWGY